LLIGQFGDGQILAYDPTTDAFLGTLNGRNGMPIDNPFLWAMNFRTGGPNTNTFSLYFTAGYNNQMDGLFGEIAPAPEPGTITLLLAATGSLGAGKLWLRERLNAEAFSQRQMSHTSKSRMCGTFRLIP
jgi:hypothetical protein